jgi:hypothetical protein
MVLIIILSAKKAKADDRRSSCLHDVPSIFFFKVEMHWLSAPELDTPEDTGLRLVSADTA